MASTQAARSDRILRVLMLADDPYLAHLLSHLDADVELESADFDAPLVELVTARPDVVIAREDDPRLTELADYDSVGRLVAVSDEPRASLLHRQPSRVDAVLRRPFARAEVARAVGLEGQDHRPPVPEGPLRRVRRMMPALRVTAVAFAAVFKVLVETASVASAILLSVAFLWALARTIWRRSTPVLLLLDLAVVAVALALSGGVGEGYTILAIAVVVEIGLVAGWRQGVVAGSVLSLTGLPGALQVDPADVEELVSAFLVVALLPVAGLTAGLGSRLASERAATSERALLEANRMGVLWVDFAREVPGSLELHSIGEAVVGEVIEETGASGALLLVESGSDLISVASAGNAGPTLHVDGQEQPWADLLRGATHEVALDAVDDTTKQLLASADRWIAEPLKWAGARIGLLLAAIPAGGEARARDRMAGIAREAVIAVDNARTYESLRSATVDAERRRLAAEMHDGLAQVLAHLRFELDMIAAGTTPQAHVPDEVARLARIAERALGETRATITGLRASVATGGLGAALRDYVRDLQGLAGPGISIEVQTEVRLAAHVEQEAFRIAQEAVSNALRHASPSTVSIRLTADEETMVLVIDDDGAGLENGTDTGSGLGLDGMRERAKRCGSRLHIDTSPGGGTRVILRCPLTAEMSPTAREVATP